MGRLAPIRDYIESLVHQSARQDPLTAARHRAFIAPRLIGGCAALAALPVYLIARGVPGALEVAVFAWLVVPILSAHFLSRTGRYATAHALSSLALAGLIGVMAAATGGVESFAALWLVVVPLEAALSASRRVVAFAAAFALATAGLLLLLGMAGALPVISADPDGHAGLMGVGLISAALYGTCLALGVASLAHTGFRMLRAEEDRYRLLAEATSDVVTCHGVDGTVRFASPAAEQLFGIPAKKLLGHGLVDRVHVADRPALLHALTDAAATCGAREAEFRALRPDADGVGTDVWIELRCRPLERSARASFTLPSATVAVMRDITERKAQQQALESARGEAEWANAGKSRFLATVSHELRTPLNAIIGFSDMLLHDSPTPLDPARRRDYAQLIKDSGAHLLAVVNSILDMAKLETGNFAIAPEALAPAPSIAQCCELMELSARGGGVALVTRVPAELPAVRADRRAVHQILINLISNAIKFTPRGGAVTVSANAEAQWVALTVTDTGVGIAEADLPRVGDPFFQSGASYDRRHDGTGLGVSIVKGLVDLHGGRLDIASRLGHGTSVTVRLPRHGARAAAGAGETPAVRKAVRSASLPSQQMRVKKRA